MVKWYYKEKGESGEPAHGYALFSITIGIIPCSTFSLTRGRISVVLFSHIKLLLTFIIICGIITIIHEINRAL